MKQNIFHYISKLIFSGENNAGLKVINFHPSFFGPLIGNLKSPVVVRVEDSDFGSIYKHLSAFWNNDSVVFLTGPSKTRQPSGFKSNDSDLIIRAGALLSQEKDVKIVFYTDGGGHQKIINKKLNYVDFNYGCEYDSVEAFLHEESYTLVDQVMSAGEYCLRGGIIDVFPQHSSHPVRIDFFDSLPKVYRFDVENQISTHLINNYKILSVSKNEGLSLQNLNFNGWLKLNYSSKEVLSSNIKTAFKKIHLNKISFNDFHLKKEINQTKPLLFEHLSVFGVVYDGFSICLPAWFINKSPTKRSPFVPSSSLNISEIKSGDFIVHQYHGVGVCVGLSKTYDQKKSYENLVIKYSDGGIVSVETESLHLVSFYAKQGTETVVVDSLSKRAAWQRKKRAAKKRAESVVKKLLQSYLYRQKTHRNPYLAEPNIEKAFIESFPYQETSDQLSAWKAIDKDLSSNRPMDRLLCGDVGFGKTEIAIRAAFRTILSNKRVLVLAPTTILANQLFSSFKSRLEPFAINVDVVSRLNSLTKKNNILSNISNNNNDLIVGTSALLNNKAYTKNLGLLIIDEEHRFGVKHKENIRLQKGNIDVLSMSATPIPRSINLALSGVFSISMLQSPPMLRKPIYTSINYNNKELLSSVLMFEFNRGGQSYFVHNNVQTIQAKCQSLQKILPGLNINYIHGKEKAGEIERKMSLFISKKIDVLVCTSIIESGIDISSANTIIINNSHLFGLSQLYQMRGRVGRGSFQAFAYLLIPKNIVLSNAAYKRIKTIKDNTSLGSGYNIARSDMDIRGAGSMFGYSQSGGSGSVGYEFYTKLIERAFNDSLEKQSGSTQKAITESRFYSKRIIPEEYINDENTRMSIYKTLSSINNLNLLDDVIKNLINRFGPPPASFQNIINEIKLKLSMKDSIVSSIIRKGCGVIVKFHSLDKIFSMETFVVLLNKYWLEFKIDFHFIPTNNNYFLVCFHLSENEDCYSRLVAFIDKFKG